MAFFRPFALERHFAKSEFSARHLLSCSDCETISTAELLALEEGAEEEYLSLRLGYTETRGDPLLREQISLLYEGIGSEGILVHAGAEEAILDFCLACLSPRDHVIVNFPCYQSLAEIPRALGCAVDPWPLREEGGRWAFDIEALERLMEPRTRLVILNAPHNPTGALPTKPEFDAIIALCSRSKVLLFSDEVYRYLELDEGRRLPSACEVYENAVSLNVLSKSAGLAGLRIGWLATRRADLLDAVVAAKDYSTICSSGPSEFLARIAVRHLGELAGRNRALAAANLAEVEAFFDKWGDFASLTRPEGGSVGFPLLAPGPLTEGADADALAERLLAEAGIMIAPGSCFGSPKDRFRLGYGRASLPSVLEALEAWLGPRS
jgi:aspartate/methionine/tyrosine aminotransferase